MALVGRVVPPWKRENDETATSPRSGDSGLFDLPSFTGACPMHVINTSQIS